MSVNLGDIGNIVSRLQGLKNLSGRKVKDTPEFLQNLETPEMDVRGTYYSPTLPTSNEPSADLGGELTAQSYDVRANTATPPPPEEDSFLSKLGRGLSAAKDYIVKGYTPHISEEAYRRNPSLKRPQTSLAQSPPVETEEVDLQEGLPPVTSSEQVASDRLPPPEQASGIGGALWDYVSPSKRREVADYNKQLMEDAQLRVRGINPETYPQEMAQKMEEAKASGYQQAVYGAAEELGNHPALQAKFKEITGIDYEPQIASQISVHEEAMEGVEDALNGIDTQLTEQAEAIKQRILNNQTTDADKYYIGMALLMPLLVGAVFGKEAALGALGGGAQGVADVLGSRQKMLRSDEESLRDIAKQQATNQEKVASLGLEKAKLGPALRKLLPEDKNEHLKGMQEATWVNPETGEEERGVKIKPGLVARPEFITSKEALTDVRKAANELSEVKSFTDDVNDITDDVVKIVSQLEDPSSAWKGFTQLLTKANPSALSLLSQDVEFDGRRQNAGVLLRQKLGILANKYGQSQELGQLDRAAQSHIKTILENPTDSFITPRDSISQILEVRRLVQNSLMNQARNKGFYPEFLKDSMSRSNNEVRGRLNAQENDKRLADMYEQAKRA